MRIILKFPMSSTINEVNQHPDAKLTCEEFIIKYADVIESLNELDNGNQYLIKIHLSLPPYNKMTFDKAVDAIKSHCSIH